MAEAKGLRKNLRLECIIFGFGNCATDSTQVSHKGSIGRRYVNEQIKILHYIYRYIKREKEIPLITWLASASPMTDWNDTKKLNFFSK